jgi:hypothetical protein
MSGLLKDALRAMATVALFASAGHAQAPKAPQNTLRLSGPPRIDVVADFTARVRMYVDLRSTLEQGLAVRIVTTDPEAIRTAVRMLAMRIRAARANAREGDIFTPAVSAAFRQALLLEARDHTCAAIMDDNPGEFSHHINDGYPEGVPLSTVPPNILAALPALPDDVQYRFLGRHLILLDARSGVILDEIRDAIGCANGGRPVMGS